MEKCRAPKIWLALASILRHESWHALSARRFGGILWAWQASESSIGYTTWTNETVFKLDNTANMGRVRTKTVKKSAKVIIERYYPKLTLDFETNKRICDEIAIISSKRLRNKVCLAISQPQDLG